MLQALPEHCPQLEHLSYEPYGVADTVELLQTAVKLKHLTSLSTFLSSALRLEGASTIVHGMAYRVWDLLDELAEKGRLEHLDLAYSRHSTDHYSWGPATVVPEMVRRLISGSTSLKVLALAEKCTEKYTAKELASFAACRPAMGQPQPPTQHPTISPEPLLIIVTRYRKVGVYWKCDDDGGVNSTNHKLVTPSNTRSPGSSHQPVRIQLRDSGALEVKSHVRERHEYGHLPSRKMVRGMHSGTNVRGHMTRRASEI